MHPTHRFPASRRPRSLLTLALLALLPAAGGGCATTADESIAFGTAEHAVDTVRTQDAAAVATGRVVAGPTNITEFRPAEKRGAVASASAVDLRGVFEDLGPDGTLWYQHVQTLANPYFEGRVNGSRGTERAREYMEFFFRLYGLEPAFPSAESGALGGAADALWTSYAQPFEFSAGRQVEVKVKGEHAAIDGRSLAEGTDYVVLGNSGSGEARGPVTFVGYGIERGVDAYTSFDDDSDLTDRIALLLRYEPLEDDGVSKWAETRFSPNAGLAPKMRACADRGAVGIMLVNPPDCRDGRQGLEPLSRSRRFGNQMRIPVIQVSHDAASRFLEAAAPSGGDLMAWRRQADEEQVRTVDLADHVVVAFGAEVSRDRQQNDVEAANVGAVLRGRGALADEWIVIGGHYDHNGYGMFGTDPSNGPLFPGADDNASGTAGMLVLAKRLSEAYAEAGDTDRRSVLFIGFDAEERGLHGSRHFANSTTIDPERMNILLNMDMIGRLRSDNLSVMGVGTAEGLEELLRPHFEGSGLTVSVNQAGSGRSDDANFNRIGVPAMHFFTGMHPEYTSPADQAYTVNPAGAVKIMDLMYGISMDLAMRPERLRHREAGRRRGRDRGTVPVRLGIQPGTGEDLDTGILVDSVSEGASAADAGMRANDVMLAWDGDALDGMRTLWEKLRASKPGDVVTITVRRGSETIDLPVTLKAGGGGR